jgi:hypothetical protein
MPWNARIQFEGLADPEAKVGWVESALHPFFLRAFETAARCYNSTVSVYWNNSFGPPRHELNYTIVLTREFDCERGAINFARMNILPEIHKQLGASCAISEAVGYMRPDKTFLHAVSDAILAPPSGPLERQSAANLASPLPPPAATT